MFFRRHLGVAAKKLCLTGWFTSNGLTPLNTIQMDYIDLLEESDFATSYSLKKHASGSSWSAQVIRMAHHYGWEWFFLADIVFSVSLCALTIVPGIVFGIWLFSLYASFSVTRDNIKKVFFYVDEYPYFTFESLLRDFQGEDKNPPDESTKREIRDALNWMKRKGVLTIITLANKEYWFSNSLLDSLEDLLQNHTTEHIKSSFDELTSILHPKLSLSSKELAEFILLPSNHLDRYNFEDGQFYVHDLNIDRVLVCSVCGRTCIADDGYVSDGEYFCSEYCRETDAIAQRTAAELRKATFERYGIQAAGWGAAAAAISHAWGDQVKIFSPHTQGHGFAAERANSMIDQIHGELDARVIGIDNARNGADRISGGQLIQTKYCQSATASVNTAFDSKSGMFRYFDSHGEPMQLEVPKDQYVKAIQLMREKISEGKVPGITNPDEAQGIIRRGSITYEQSKAICKFGTVESLAYDAGTGIVVASSATGISFVVATAIGFWKTKDIKQSIQSAVILAASTGGKAFCAYILTAQMQRIPAVNAFLDKAIHINFGGHGKMVKHIGKGLTKMSGSNQAFSNKAANATVKGAVVAAGAMLAITSTIEVSRMVSGRISGMQCMKNIGVAAGGIATGTIGATIGGAALSFIPVVGTFVGSVVGGAIGGMLGAKATKSVLDSFIEDDAPQMLRIVSMQFEYFVGKYCLNNEELELAANELDALAAKIGWLQDVFSKEGYRVQFVSREIQPIFLRIMARRAPLSDNQISQSKLLEALDVSEPSAVFSPA